MKSKIALATLLAIATSLFAVVGCSDCKCPTPTTAKKCCCDAPKIPAAKE